VAEPTGGTGVVAVLSTTKLPVFQVPVEFRTVMVYGEVAELMVAMVPAASWTTPEELYS
jgi:hypothetical protein